MRIDIWKQFFAIRF